MYRFWLFAILGCLALPLPVVGETVSRVAAVVNDEIITTAQLQRELQQAEVTDDKESREQVLEKMIEKLLLQQRVRELGLKVNAEELEAAILDVQRQNKLTRPQLEEALRQQGMSFAEYQENLQQQILQFKLMAREVQSKVEVTNQEISDYYRDHIDSYRLPPSLRLSRLSFPLPEKALPEKITAARQQAETARQQLLKGEAFAAVLAASGGEGGDMGIVEKEALTKSFAEAVENLKVGEISPVIESAQGFHLLLVTERTDGEVRPLDSVKDEITRILSEKKNATGVQEWLQGLRKKANIEIRDRHAGGLAE